METKLVSLTDCQQAANSLGESCRPPFHRIRISNVLVDHLLEACVRDLQLQWPMAIWVPSECVHPKVCCNTTA